MTRDPETILVLLPNWLGDVAMSTPALRALKKRFPEAAIVACGRSSACELVHGLPYLSATMPVPSRPSLMTMFRLPYPEGHDRPDLAVLFPHSFRSALMARVLGAKEVLGYSRGERSLLLTDRVEPHRVNGKIEPIYMAQEYLNLIAALGCKDDGAGLELTCDPQLASVYLEKFAGPGPLVGIAPGAAFGPSKLWPADRYAAVIDRLHADLGARIVLITGPGEEEIRDSVRSKSKAPMFVLDDGKPSVARLKAAISLLDLLVGNDSGTRHIAVAFHVPTVCIMGPTSPAYSYGPYERGKVLRIDVDCGPCQKPVCTTDHRCMTGISSDLVFESATRLLSEFKHV
jgi:heptosyltransferase-2